MKKTITYEESGVNPAKAAKIIGDFSSYQKSRPKDPSILTGIGPFASCYSLKSVLANMEDPVMVTCCDGVGTKLKLALDWNEISHLGQDLVAMNINDLLCTGAEPLVFLDYYACGALNDAQLSQLLKSIQHGCEIAECSLVGGETAEMPGLYHDSDFDLAGFAVGMVDRRKILAAGNVIPGDVLLAISSSGFHSNGYSLVRKIVERENLKPGDKCPFTGGTWAETLLKPTHIYVSSLKGMNHRIHALAHITGGGLFENLPRIIPKGMNARISAAKWNIPPLFRWFQEKAGLNDEQVLSTFNCGVGMILACARDQASFITAQFQGSEIRCWEIGAIERGTEGQVDVVWE